MSEHSELEDRLRAAIDRIERVAMALPDPNAPPEIEPAAYEALKTQLDDERTSNAQLIERVKVLKDRQEGQVAQLEQDLRDARAAEAERNKLHDTMKATIDDLQDQVARLTEANRGMVGDPQLVNTAMMVELEAMRASRKADIAEVDEILAELKPYLPEAANA